MEAIKSTRTLHGKYFDLPSLQSGKVYHSGGRILTAGFSSGRMTIFRGTLEDKKGKEERPQSMGCYTAVFDMFA